MEKPDQFRVGIVGPESTGKSALTSSLALHYNAPWVPEIAREFLERLNRPYNAEDVEQIARLQWQVEHKMRERPEKLLFCDTTLLVIKIWMINSFGYCPSWIHHSLASDTYDLILLTDIDLPWQPDPLREHPEKREYFRDWYERELMAGDTPWYWIRGSGKDRLYAAIEVVDKLYKA